MSTSEVSILPSSSIDRRLIRAAAKYATPEEMSEAVMGKLTPAQCVDRVKTILESKTVFDEVQERRLLLVKMSEHLDWMHSQRENEKSWGAIARMYKVVSDQIERANINLTDVSTKLAADHAQYMVEGFMVGLERILKELREEREIVVDDEDVIELMQVGVNASQEYIERVTMKEIDV